MHEFEADILCVMGEESLEESESITQVCERIFYSGTDFMWPKFLHSNALVLLLVEFVFIRRAFFRPNQEVGEETSVLKREVCRNLIRMSRSSFSVKHQRIPLTQHR